MSGTVKDFLNNPIENVSVTSLNNNISGTSNSSGSFTVSKISPIIYFTENSSFPMNFIINNNNLVLSINSTKRVLIELFTPGGKKVLSELFETLNKGTYYIPLSIQKKSPQILLLCVTLNRTCIIKKYISVNNIVFKNQEITSISTGKTGYKNSMASQSDVIDTLVFSHKEYLKKRVWIFKYSQEINVIMWDKNLALSDEIPQWTENQEDFASYDTAQLYDLIDGGATLYNEHGLIDGITQYFTKGNDKICQILVNNFGSAQKSRDMHKYRNESVSSEVKVPGYDESTAIGDKILGGIDVYARFDRFNIELSLRGYTSIESAATDAKLFIQVYESKIRKLSK